MANSNSLERRAALITGGGSGIGLATAKALVADGAAVTICGRTPDKLDRAVAEIEESVRGTGAEPRVRGVVCDVTVEGDVENAVAVAVEHGGGALQMIVAGAGTGSAGPIVNTDLAAWRHVLATNLDGAFLTIKHGARALTAASGGSIVAISSIAAPLTHRLMAAYCVSKAALEALVRNAADELGASGIRVNAVRPGLVPTDLASGLTMNPRIVEDYLEQMPLGRLGQVDDVAAGIRYLLGPESSWVTGQCFAIDGGHTLRRGPDITVGFRTG
jgi:NAD(P)-dependent dehydrogenase (short-subunit alcohol dehydrogenase family)